MLSLDWTGGLDINTFGTRLASSFAARKDAGVDFEKGNQKITYSYVQ